jgi:hypothetical protein
LLRRRVDAREVGFNSLILRRTISETTAEVIDQCDKCHSATPRDQAHGRVQLLSAHRESVPGEGE